MHSKLLIGTVFLSLGLSGAGANTIVAGYDFQDSAFADSVISSSGIYAAVTSSATYNPASAAQLQAAVTGSSVTKYAIAIPPTGGTVAGANIKLGFTDNYLVNGDGNDLALFELGTPSTFAVTIGVTTINYSSVHTFFTTVINGETTPINMVQIDLSLFGVAPNTQLSNILIGMGIGSSVPSLTVVGALHSAPVNQSVPDAGSTISMLGAAFVGLGLLKRKF